MLLPLAHILLRVICRYMSLVCINVTNIFFCRVVFFPAVFFSRTANQSSGVDVVHATRQVCCTAENTAGEKTTRLKKMCLQLCKLETCTYISLAAMYGLTAIDTSLVAG